ncbi:MAG: hypothetical protein SOR57_04075 [Parabacteroides sp.]|nr:hypothetical protein [Parabacteroides sp.]
MESRKLLKLFLPLLVLGMLFFGVSSCDKDEDVLPWFDEIENEHIEFELKDAPAYVVRELKGYGYVLVSYSEEADEYFGLQENMPAKSISNSADTTDFPDAEKKMIAVKSSDFEKYNISIPSKVYITASVTNNNTRNIEGLSEIDIEYILRRPQPKKAYLKDIRLRQ